jgi:hypothetical protein
MQKPRTRNGTLISQLSSMYWDASQEVAIPIPELTTRKKSSIKLILSLACGLYPEECDQVSQHGSASATPTFANIRNETR